MEEGRGKLSSCIPESIAKYHTGLQGSGRAEGVRAFHAQQKKKKTTMFSDFLQFGASGSLALVGSLKKLKKGEVRPK